MLLNILSKFFFKNKDAEEDTKTNTDNQDRLVAAVIIGVDNDQQYAFDIKWNYDNLERSADALANIILGINYGLFTEHIKKLLEQHDPENIYDAAIVRQCFNHINKRNDILNNLLNDTSPLVRPSKALKPNNENQ